MSGASSSLVDIDTPSGIFLTAASLPQQSDDELVLQSTAQAMQRIEQELAVLRGMGYPAAFSTDAVISLAAADQPLDAPDMAEAIEEAQKELEAADEAREWRGQLEDRAEVTEALERHDSTTTQERQTLQDYLEALRERVEEPGLSFSDERYCQLLAEREAHGVAPAPQHAVSGRGVTWGQTDHHPRRSSRD